MLVISAHKHLAITRYILLRSLIIMQKRLSRDTKRNAFIRVRRKNAIIFTVTWQNDTYKYRYRYTCSKAKYDRMGVSQPAEGLWGSRFWSCILYLRSLWLNIVITHINSSTNNLLPTTFKQNKIYTIFNVQDLGVTYLKGSLNIK